MSGQWWVIGYPVGAALSAVLWYGLLFILRKGWRNRGWWHR